jgi:hypothetical protein
VRAAAGPGLERYEQAFRDIESDRRVPMRPSASAG